MDTQAKIAKYADIKAQIAALEAEADVLKPEIISIVDELNPTDHEIETDFGKFSVVQKRKYTYSIETQAKETDLKSAKKEEEAKGIAPYEIQPYLKFTSKLEINN